MSTKLKNIIQTTLFAVLLVVITLFCWFKENDDFSEAERRTLASFPELSWESIFSGEFMKEFETYTLDQFPLRDTFRTVKSVSQFYVFGRNESNDLYMADGYISKLEYPLSYPMLDHASERFQYLYDTYLADKDMNIYFSTVPDKNYYMAAPNGYLSLDYDELISYMRENTQYMSYIDITDKLELGDYYRTDSHWKQECITEAAGYLAEQMGTALSGKYTENILDIPFEGVFAGQSALPLKPDEIVYLTNETLDKCIVTNLATGKAEPAEMYDFEQAEKGDAYDLFLSGAEPIMIIENPSAENDRELIIFRDSFGSSIAPLLAEGYSKVTVLDIRYVQSMFLGNFAEFNEGSDVLFLYSAGMLNSSLGLR